MSISDIKTTSLVKGSNNWAFKIWEIERTAEDRLRHSSYLELRNVWCDYHEGVLTLRGHVPSYHLKQMAQAIMHDLEDDLELNNQLEVVSPGDVRQSKCNTRNVDSPHRYV
jgi:osmotically-inducible protein OsmY